MPNVPKYTHQDVVAFVREGVVPEDLSCSLGYHLMRRPVYMRADASRRPYEASAARQALELKARDPFTRNNVRLEGALVAAHDVQQGLRIFRAMVLGYTKVTTYLQALDAPPREQVVALQTARNAALKLAARKPLTQPSSSRHVCADAREAFWRAHDALRPAKKESDTAEAKASIAETLAWAATQGLSRPIESLEDLGIDTRRFTASFGSDALASANAAAQDPSPATLQALARAACDIDVSPSAMLLFAQGQLIEHMIDRRAYAALATVAPALTQKSNKFWCIRRYTHPGNVFVGRRNSAGQPHGVGLMVSPDGAYAGGRWARGKLDGTAVRVEGDASWAGSWHVGCFEEGRHRVGDVTQTGTFRGNKLQGHGVSYDRAGVSQGLWANGKMIQGMRKANSGDVLVYGPSDRPNEEAIGVATGPKWDAERYCGVLVDGKRHGLGGAQVAGAEELHLGLWQNDRLSGPGARMTEAIIEFGVWSGHPRKLTVSARERNEQDTDSDSDAFTDSDSDTSAQ